MSILKVCCCKVFKVISILSVEFYYSCVRFKRFKSNLHESLLFSLNHRKLSAAMTYRFSSSMLNTWRTALLLDCFGTAVNWALVTMLRCARWWVFQHAWFQWSIKMQKHCELINWRHTSIIGKMTQKNLSKPRVLWIIISITCKNIFYKLMFYGYL